MKYTLFLLFSLITGLILVGCSPGQEAAVPATDPAVEQAEATELPKSPTRPATTDRPDSTPLPTPIRPEPTATIGVISTETLVPLPPTSEPTPTALTPLTFHDLSLMADDIFFFPVPELIAGDPVSIQVMPTISRGLAPNDVDVRILVDGQELVTGNLNWRKLSGDTVGLYQWVWDTTGQAGEHIITAILDPLDLIQIGDEDPDNNQVTITVEVQPAADSELEVTARWRTATASCCVIHVVTGTAADRDLEELLPRVEAAFTQASLRLGEPLTEPYDVYLVDRVIGQGGYASDTIVISYLDRNYAGGGLDELLVHEATHLIDDAFAADQITFLSEGIAVWATGGHYQQQDLGQWMAALIELGEYVPISEVINNFRATQHEIGYLEGASLIEYLVKVYGWPVIRRFSGQVTADDGATLADAVDLNMRVFFGRTLAQIEADWMAYLKKLPRDRLARENLSTTIRYYEVMRRYQIAYDPTAYYLYAWLPSPELAEQNQATADFTRHPESAVNIALEAMLQAANQALLQGNLDQSNALLDSVVRVIDNEGKFLDPLARAYWNIVMISAEMEYEVQQLTVRGNRATGLVSRPGEQALAQWQLVLNDDQTWTPVR